MYHHHRRCGVTLTEVLVAIFVCGLGLMALMTLFPLGALNMAEALKDDRCGHCAANATAILRTMWRLSLENSATQADPGFQALQGKLAAGPVYIDPVGFNGYGGQPLPGGIQRVTLNNANYQQALRWCTLLDDIRFQPNATPEGNAGAIYRDGRYSWAWMVRQLDPYSRVLVFQVVVYHNRSMAQNVGLVPIGEVPGMGTAFTGPNTATVTYGAKPSIKKGGWILDGGSGYFYRATAVQDLGGSLNLTVDTPFRNGGVGPIVFLDNVAEVFERSTLE
jgi:hypothetical protein